MRNEGPPQYFSQGPDNPSGINQEPAQRPETINPTTPEQTIVKYLSLAPDKEIRRDNVVLRGTTFAIHTLLISYRSLDDSVEDKAGKVAEHWEIPREAVEASLIYYGRNKDVMDARILLETDSHGFDPLFEDQVDSLGGADNIVVREGEKKRFVLRQKKIKEAKSKPTVKDPNK